MQAALLATGLEREERLDTYRQEVEELLGDLLAFAQQDDFERFFLLVEACFEQEVSEDACARAWLNHG
jgi:GAF domain-containing protein